MSLQYKNIFIAFISLSLIIWSKKSQAQKGTEQLGDYVSFNKIHNGVSVKATNASLFITAYSSNIIRVRVSKEPDEGDTSYAVIIEPKGNISEVNETEKNIIFSTDSLFIYVEKSPLRINFFRKIDNKFLAGDDETLGIVWAGTEVTS